jgi:hypothetical protein
MRADETLCRLLDEADDERREIERLRARGAEVVAEYDAKIAALEQREQQLRHRLESNEGVVAWLADLGEERVERAVRELGWVEQESDGVVA